jgi:hypothetical protein
MTNIIYLEAYRAKSKATTLNPHNHQQQRTITSKEQLIRLLEMVQIEAIMFNSAFKKMPEQTNDYLIHIKNHYEGLEEQMTTALNALMGGVE